MPEFDWVEQVQTVDAIDRDVVQALDANPGWKLLGVGVGSGGQSTLTYGWPWPGEVADLQDLRDVIADRLRQIDPQMSGRNTIATELARTVRAAGLIRGG